LFFVGIVWNTNTHFGQNANGFEIKVIIRYSYHYALGC
jgi:hypothetical protein